MSERVMLMDVEYKEAEGEEIEISAQVKVMMKKPAQDERLPDTVADEVEVSGQELKRKLYQRTMEYFDLEIALDQRSGKGGKGIVRWGKRRYTIKAVFGTVIMKRQRIKHADGSTEIPSAKRWKTPQQQLMTQGLRNAVCDIVAKESYASTVRRIAECSGEENLISKSSVKNILHAEGGRLAAAQQERAEQVFAADARKCAAVVRWMEENREKAGVGKAL